MNQPSKAKMRRINQMKARPAFIPEKQHPDLPPMKQHNPPSRYHLWVKLGVIEAETQTEADKKGLEVARCFMVGNITPDLVTLLPAATKVKP